VKQNVTQAPLAGGVETKLPQNPVNAGEAENLVVDKGTGGWSTRLGYEPFVASPTSWAPFGSVGQVTSLHCAQDLAGGARQHLLFEAGGTLYLLYEAAGADQLVTLATNRNVPSASEAGSWYTTTGYGTVVTNGVDRPILVRPWPLGSYTDAVNTAAQCVRPFGFDGLPTPADPRHVKPFPPPGGGEPRASGNGAVTLGALRRAMPSPMEGGGASASPTTRVGMTATRKPSSVGA